MISSNGATARMKYLPYGLEHIGSLGRARVVNTKSGPRFDVAQARSGSRSRGVAADGATIDLHHSSQPAVSRLTQHHPKDHAPAAGGTADRKSGPGEPGGTKCEDGQEPGNRQGAGNDGGDEQGNAGEDPGHPQLELPFLMGAAEPLAH